MQQPPPRKAKIGQDLKNVQHDQWAKLQSKHQTDSDLLEDVRDFAKQRAAVEKVYAQSLQKLSTQFVQKRTFPPPCEKSEEQRDRTILQVWKSLLEETEKIGRARLTASETISTQIIDTIKIQKNTRTNTLKKCGDLTNVWNEEVQASVRELIKARKNYADAEKIAQDARGKAAEAENRLNKGSVKFFQSRSSLEKTTAKLVSRRTTCDRRAAHMRNEYLLCLAAANAHRKRLHETDVPYLMESLDGDFYERLRNHFRVFSTTEIETSTYVKSCFQKISDEADMISRCHQQQKFLKDNPIFTDIVQYVYDPVENDEVSNLIMDNTESLYLERDARRWATQVAKESNHIESLSRQMEACQPYLNQLRGSDNSSDSGFSQDKDPEVKLDTLREARRKAETNKLKAEAKLDVMRNAGIDVEEWLSSAYEAIAKEAEIEAQTMLQQQHSQQEQQHMLVEQQHYETSHEECDNTEQQQHAPHMRELHSYSITSFDSADDFDAAYDDQISQGSSGHSISSKNPAKCKAIFDYTAQREDELTIREHDVLELIEDSEGDGWLKARNQYGEVGYVPENYIEIEKRRLSFSASPKADKDSAQQQQGQVLGHASSQSSVDYEVQAVMGVQGSGEDSGRPAICMVRALYDYTGSCHEELSFADGTIFKLLRRDENGIDDGFWEGEISGRIGVFPSLLVEELDSESRQGSNDSKPKSRSRPKFRNHRCVPSIIIDDAHCWSNDSSYTCSSEDSYAEEQFKPSPRSLFSNRTPPHSRRPPHRTSPRHPIAARKANRNSVGRSFKKSKKIEYKKAPKKGTSRAPLSPSHNPIPLRVTQVQSKRTPKSVDPSRKSPSASQFKECNCDVPSTRNRPKLPEPRRGPVDMGSHNKWFRIQSTDDTVLKASALIPHQRAPPPNQQYTMYALDKTKSPSLNSNMNQAGHYEVSADQINKSQTLTRPKSCWDCKETQPCCCRPQLAPLIHNYHGAHTQDKHRHDQFKQRKQHPQRQDPHNQAQSNQDPHRKGPYRQDHHRQNQHRQDPQRQDQYRQDPHGQNHPRQDPRRQDQRKQDPRKQDLQRQEHKRQHHRQDPQRQDPRGQNHQRQDQHRQDLSRADVHKQDQLRQNPHIEDKHRQDPNTLDQTRQGLRGIDLRRQDPHREDPHRHDPQRQDPHRQDPHRQDPHRQDQIRQDQTRKNPNGQGPQSQDHTRQGQTRKDHTRQSEPIQDPDNQDSQRQNPYRREQQEQDPTEQDECREYVNEPDVQALALLKKEKQKQGTHKQEIPRQISEEKKKQAVYEILSNGRPPKETDKHRSSAVNEEDQSEEDKALSKSRFLNARKTLERKLSAPIISRQEKASISELKDEDTEDNHIENKAIIQNGKRNGDSVASMLKAEANTKTFHEQTDEDTSCRQENVIPLSNGISIEMSKGDLNKKKTTFCFSNQKMERKLSASFHSGTSSTSTRSLRDEKRATSIPDLSLLEGMYSTRIGPPISPRTESLIKKAPPHGILKQSQSLDYRKVKGPPYNLDSIETKPASHGPKRDHSCPERLSDVCIAVVEEEEEEVKRQPHIDQYARVARNRDERSKGKAQGCSKEAQEAVKRPTVVERRAASLDEADQEGLNQSSTEDSKASCPTASLIFQQRQKGTMSPPNYRKASCPNALAVLSNGRVSSRVISPTLERHLRNLNSFWSQNRASVVLTGSQDPSSMSQATPQRSKSQRNTSRSNSLRTDSLLEDRKQKANRSRSCSPARNRQSAPVCPINRQDNKTLCWDPLRTSNAPSTTTTTNTTSTPVISTSTSPAPSASRSPCSSPWNSPRLSRKQGDAVPGSPDYESAEPTMSPPAFSPPPFAPPPLPPVIISDKDPDYEEVDKERPASANELVSPPGQYGYMRQPSYVECARSVPSSPVTASPPSGSIKPARAAPPPPSSKKKADRQRSLQYENTTPVSYV